MAMVIVYWEKNLSPSTQSYYSTATAVLPAGGTSPVYPMQNPCALRTDVAVQSQQLNFDLRYQMNMATKLWSMLLLHIMITAPA